MAIRIVPFEPDLLPLVRDFSMSTWARPRTDAYFRWRYLDCPSMTGYLALDESGCVGSLWAFLRPYRIAGRDVTCLETHDWFCLPRLRGSGIGIRLMQSMMRRSEPIVTVGGGADTLTLLPRLHWRGVGDFSFFALPLEGGALAAHVGRRTGIPPAWLRAAFRTAVRPWLTPRPGRALPHAAIEEAAELTAEVPELYRDLGPTGILPLPDPERVHWLLRAPEEIGHFALLHFRVAGRLRGWSLSRVHRTSHGCEATLIDLFAPPDDEELYRWMLSETLVRLLPHGPDTIRAGTSSPALERALRHARFRPYQTLPISLWPQGIEVPSPPHHIANNTADMPLFPYPES